MRHITPRLRDPAISRHDPGNFCHDIIAAQTAEIQQMDQWLCDWHGRCGGAA